MKIRTKLILNHSVLSILLLVTFSFTVLFFSVQHRHNDFKTRLLTRAKSAVRMLIDVPQIDSTLLSIIDDNTLTTMSNFSMHIYDSSGKLLYSYHDENKKDISVNSIKTINIVPDISNSYISFKHYYLGNTYLVDASATDEVSVREINYLIKLLIILLISSVFFILLAGIYNASWSLRPFRNLIKEIDSLGINKKKKRLDISGADELAQLSVGFNNILDQLLKAYDDQKAFVSLVSHELRTPVTALLGQIEITLKKQRTEKEYQQVLKSVYDDGIKIAQIINSFLELAEANLAPEYIKMENIRIDELIFSMVSDYRKNYPNYKINVQFIKTPENENQFICFANERLLKILFRNLIENAFKFSDNKKVEISINVIPGKVEVCITDWGIGIREDELKSVFNPLFRGQNTGISSGHGLGLAIAKKIALIHNSTINIESEINLGTKVYLSLPSISN